MSHRFLLPLSYKLTSPKISYISNNIFGLRSWHCLSMGWLIIFLTLLGTIKLLNSCGFPKNCLGLSGRTFVRIGPSNRIFRCLLITFLITKSQLFYWALNIVNVLQESASENHLSRYALWLQAHLLVMAGQSNKYIFFRLLTICCMAQFSSRKRHHSSSLPL